MDDCIFCKIVSGEIPCHKIYEDEFTLAFLDISGDIYGHTLVVPKYHADNLLMANDEMLDHILKTVRRISKHYVDDCGFTGVNIMNNTGLSAGQTIMHLHFHIIPRKENDNVKVYPDKVEHDFDFAEICNFLKI
ncbi:MAG: HIT family protein [bacterium]|nr:HIT family protein [bacterium]